MSELQTAALVTAHLREAEAAERAGLAPSTLAKMRSRKEGPPFIKVGRQVRYPENQLRDWIASRTCFGGAHDGNAK